MLKKGQSSALSHCTAQTLGRIGVSALWVVVFSIVLRKPLVVDLSFEIYVKNMYYKDLQLSE